MKLIDWEKGATVYVTANDSSYFDNDFVGTIILVKENSLLVEDQNGDVWDVDYSECEYCD